MRGPLSFALALGLSLFHSVAAEAQPVLLEAKESEYNSIFVYQNADEVIMTFGHNKRLYTESIANTKNPLELPVEYTRFMTLPLAYQAQTSKVLEIGLGGGSTVWYLRNTFPELDIQAVELDPEVAALAQKYFFVKPDEQLQIAVRDGRLFLARSDETYDVILIDAYRGPFVPFHLLTKEFFEVAKSKLSEGGVVAQNVEPTTMLYDSAVATIASVFANVEIYRASGNYVLVAYDGPRKTQEELQRRAAEIDERYSPIYKMTDLLASREIVEASTGSVLTDDFAPVEALHSVERHNERMPE